MKRQDQVGSKRFAVAIWVAPVFTAFLYVSAMVVSLIVVHPTEPANMFLVMSFFFVSNVLWGLRQDNLDLRRRIEQLERAADPSRPDAGDGH